MPFPRKHIPIETPPGNGPLPDEGGMAGELIHVIYSNPQNGYGVGKLRREDQPGEVMIAGMLNGAMEGMMLQLSGHWTDNPGYGRQFQVTDCQAVLPTSQLGMLRYLSSGVIPGISKRYAGQIVEHFGDRSLEILDSAPERLREIRGFGAKRVAQVKEAWQRQHADRDTFVFLQGMGISPALCKRIISRYTAVAAAEVIRRNPYRLASDVDGIGFLTADRIAASAGFGASSPLRLSAAALYCLEQASGDGHVALPPESLMAEMEKLLQCTPENAQVGIDAAIRDGKVVRENFPEGAGYASLLYSRKLYNAERRLAELLRVLMRVAALPERAQCGDGDFPAVPPSRLRKMEESLSRVILNDEQLQACRRASENALSIITGGPGVGKTTVIARIVCDALKRRWRVRLAAPTGRAARRLGESAGLEAVTIHRLLQYDPQTRKFLHGEDDPLECDLLIVDEVSMLDIFLARSLFAAVRPGTRVVLVGDRDQLPSVGPGCVLNDLIGCGRFPVTALTRIYRQREGSRIVTSAHDVNHGVMPSLANPPKGTAGDFYFYECREPSQAAEFIRKLVCRHIPGFFGFDAMEDIQVLAPMRRGQCGATALNEALQAALNPPSEEKPEMVISGETPRLFRLGDRVMQIKNNYDKQIYNGEMGRIVSMDPASRGFSVLFDQSRVSYKAEETDQLTLCYAITIHKSQGSEFPAVVMPMLDQHHIMLQRNLLYTGMTRARKLFIIVGSRHAVQTAVKNDTPALRISMLRHRLEKI